MNEDMRTHSPPPDSSTEVSGDQENMRAPFGSPASKRLRSAEVRLIHMLRQGDPVAGHEFVRDYYPDVYRYLLYLTGRSEMAEDLTQETFLRAWGGLAAFEGRASLRVWLHRIAHREFLQVLRSRRPEASLEQVAEFVTAPDTDWAGAVELREGIRTLPREQAEVLVLHYLHGYNCDEIGKIVGANVGAVKYRLSIARSHLQRELGVGDLVYLNELSVPMRQWAWLPLDQMYALEMGLSRASAGSRQTPGPGATAEETMGRRELWRNAAVGAAGVMLSETEKEVVDSRLTQKVTCAFEATALSDLCDQLRSDTGIHLIAGPSVADEKVTLLCEKEPLREVMRQLSRPFGYSWLRSGTPGQYRYELGQDLRSQLLEEELRNRDRIEALLNLDREIERYRPYLDLSPDEALERMKTAAPDERAALEKLAGVGWGTIQIYFRLSAQDRAALHSGKALHFSTAPWPSERPDPSLRSAPWPDVQLLPPDLKQGALLSLRNWRVCIRDEGFTMLPREQAPPDAVPLTAIPEVHALVAAAIVESEPGCFQLHGSAGAMAVTNRPKTFSNLFTEGPYAVGANVSIAGSRRPAAGTRRSNTPALHRRVTLEISAQSVVDHPPKARLPVAPPLAIERAEAGGCTIEPEGSRSAKVTTADVLEALHKATGLNLVSDYYTHLYPVAAVPVRDVPVGDALDQLADRLGQRWNSDDGWLQFRSARFYDERLKEVPHRLLERWITSRRAHGSLTLDDLIEMAQLLDTQLDAGSMAAGARLRYGLTEWDLARDRGLRAHLRYLATLTLEQRLEAQSPLGLPVNRMTLAQQHAFVTHALGWRDAQLVSLDDLSGGILRVEYTLPGGYHWRVPRADWTQEWRQWVVPLEPGPQGRRAPRPQVREGTPEAALAAARRLDPQADAAQIVPTELNLAVLYIPGSSNKLYVRVVRRDGNLTFSTW